MRNPCPESHCPIGQRIPSRTSARGSRSTYGASMGARFSRVSRAQPRNVARLRVRGFSTRICDHGFGSAYASWAEAPSNAARLALRVGHCGCANSLALSKPSRWTIAPARILLETRLRGRAPISASGFIALCFRGSCAPVTLSFGSRNTPPETELDEEGCLRVLSSGRNRPMAHPHE